MILQVEELERRDCPSAIPLVTITDEGRGHLDVQCFKRAGIISIDVEIRGGSHAGEVVVTDDRGDHAFVGIDSVTVETADGDNSIYIHDVNLKYLSVLTGQGYDRVTLRDVAISKYCDLTDLGFRRPGSGTHVSIDDCAFMGAFYQTSIGDAVVDVQRSGDGGRTTFTRSTPAFSSFRDDEVVNLGVGSGSSNQVAFSNRPRYDGVEVNVVNAINGEPPPPRGHH